MKLIKAIALLNVWFRRQDDGSVIATQQDIDAAFGLWSKVIESQDMNVPPVVMGIYKNYILPAYFKKRDSAESREDVQNGLVGLSSRELSAYYAEIEGTSMNDENLRKQILPQLENSGIISLEQPSLGDRRSRHIFPKWFPQKENSSEDENNIGMGIDDLPPEIVDMFFGGSKKSEQML